MTTATTRTGAAARGDSVPVHGPMVRYMRKNRGVSIGELATTIGVSESYVTRIERGTSRRVSPAVFATLRTVLGVEHEDARLLMANPQANEGE